MTQPECPKPVRWNQPAGLTGNWRGLSHAIGKGQPGAQPLRFELVRVNIVPKTRCTRLSRSPSYSVAFGSSR